MVVVHLFGRRFYSSVTLQLQYQLQLVFLKPSGLGLTSNFCGLQPDTSVRCDFLYSGQVNLGNVLVVAPAQAHLCLPGKGSLGRVYLHRLCVNTLQRPW